MNKSNIKYILMFSFVMFLFVGLTNVKALSMTSNVKEVAVGGKVILTIKDTKASPNTDYTLDLDDKTFSILNNCTKDSNKKGSKTFDGTHFQDGCNIELTVHSDLNLTSNATQTIILKNSGNTIEDKKDVIIKANKTAPAPSTTTAASQKSNNANLKLLTITSNDNVKLTYTPEFKSNVLEYSVNVDSSVTKVLVSATVEDSKASFAISDSVNKELVAGQNNKIIIDVIAEDGTKKTYTINVTKDALETDATLKELVIEEVPDFKLVENKFSYNIKLEDDVKKLKLTYVTKSSKSTVEVIGNSNLKDGSVVKINVTSEDGTKKEYKLNIVKTKKVSTTQKVVTVSNEKNPLIIMGLSLLAFSLIGGIVYVAKK